MLKLPYGVSSFAQLAQEEYYFVDRTVYIAQLEQLPDRYLFFLRPRRFGKSLFISLLQCYYGLEYATDFAELFGAYAMGQNPTPLANLRADDLRIYDRVLQLAQENQIAPLIEAVEAILQQLSSRDAIGFDEKYVKAIFASLLYSTQIYTIHSEFESDRRYVDLLLTRRPPIDPNYQFAFELKYLKQSDAHRLETIKAEGLAQMQDYLRHAKLQAMTDLRAWLIVFVGPKASVVMAVTV